jgi:hypothetical protein
MGPAKVSLCLSSPDNINTVVGLVIWLRMLCPCLFVISFFSFSYIYIYFFFPCVFHKIIIAENERKREIRLLFSSCFYCLYFIFQFEKTWKGRKDLSKYYTNVSYLHVGNIFIHRKTISFPVTRRNFSFRFKEVETTVAAANVSTQLQISAFFLSFFEQILLSIIEMEKKNTIK